MSINRNFKKKVFEVKYDGEVVATVSGLNADRIAELVRVIADDITGLLEVVTGVEFAANTPEQLADNVLKNAPTLIAKVTEIFPNLLSTIVAIGGDDADAQETVAEWPLALQVEAAAEIFRLTFVDDEGFRKFAGNVSALLQSGNALTRNSASQKNAQRTPAVPQSLADG